MVLLRVTAERTAKGLVVRSREVVEEVPDDPHYWDAISDFLLARMERDGILTPGEAAETA